MKPQDHCGVVGIISDESVGQLIYFCLRALQHRGQESAGISIFNSRIETKKGMGLVNEIFKNQIIKSLEGNSSIGHVRYSTTGTSELRNAQPVVVSSSIGDIGIAHNGDLINAEILRRNLQGKGWAFITTSDSEILIRLLADQITVTNDLIRAIRNVMRIIKGSYSITILVKDKIYAVRDPFGIKPLCFGKYENGYVIASETVALDAVGAKLIRDVEPGEIIEFEKDGFISHKGRPKKNKAHCMFEYTYFARADAVIEKKCVYDVRTNIGKKLFEEHPVEADIACSVPDSGTSYAVGFASRSNIPYAEGLMKNRFVYRTFILPYQKHRDITVREKLNPIRSVVNGKRIVLVDDSIVRGTTMRKIVKMVRNAGAKEVHVRIGTPPIIAPCYFGIDMKTRDQFIAREQIISHIAKKIEADSLGYISIKGLVDSIGIRENDLCLGCLTSEYPIKIPGERVRFQKKLDTFS